MSSRSSRVPEPAAAGMQRYTRQRRAIERVFHDQTAPLTVSEILSTAGRRVPTLSPATLYRALHSLTEAGHLERVTLPGEPPRYQWARAEHRHFFHCDACRRVFEVAGCHKPGIDRVPKGFFVREHHVVLYGTCAACAARRPKFKARLRMRKTQPRKRT